MTDWFTADTHLGHANIIRFCVRPFKDVNEMNKILIDNINEAVMPDDRLFHLGDFSHKGGGNAVLGFCRRINCRNLFIVPGNHDTKQLRELEKHFKILPAQYMYENDGFRMVFSHYRMDVWEHSHHGVGHIYGHSHAKLAPKCGHDGHGLMCFDIGVDAWEYKPISLQQVKTEMARRVATVMKGIPHESNKYQAGTTEHHGVK
jgi:calcineurin-like phosphoesterase family protein